MVRKIVIWPILSGILFSLFYYVNTYQIYLSEFYGPSLRLLVIGDFGELHPKWDFPKLPVQLVADSMNDLCSTSKVSMILSLGDNFYSEETKELFNTIRQVFTQIFSGEYIKDLPWYLSYGNHDYYYSKSYGELVEDFYENIHMPTGYWNMTIQMEGFKIDFTVLPSDIICHGNHTNPLVTKHCNSMDGEIDHSETYDWIESHFEDLSEDDELVWKIVVIHYPIFSVAVTGMDSENLKAHLLPLLRKYEVDLVLSGHNHNMQYFYSDHEKYSEYKEQDINEDCYKESEIKCRGEKIHCYFSNITCFETQVSCEDKISVEDNPGLENYTEKVIFVKGSGIHQVVQGGGGADLDPMCPDLLSPMAEYIFGKSAHGFCELLITRFSLDIKYILADGSSVFQSSIIV